ncbi:MAG: cytochrome c [Armatimonadetes bacterium]|nr:cytochrome c [Armatimonadota bacterium]
MDYFQLKSLLAVLLVAAGVTAAVSMLTLMGKSEKRLSAGTLRRIHTVSGYTFYLLVVVLTVFGLQYLGAVGDSITLRGVIHWVLASLLVFLLLLKLAIVLYFRQFLKFVPVIGMAAITLTLVVVTVSAVFFAVTGRLTRVADLPVAPAGTMLQAEEIVASSGQFPPVAGGAPLLTDQTALGDPSLGAVVFSRYCADCHYANSDGLKVGPGLAGLFSREKLDVNGRSVSEESVRDQIMSPDGTMPSFQAHLSEGELDDLVAYLEKL